MSYFEKLDIFYSSEF